MHSKHAHVLRGGHHVITIHPIILCLQSKVRIIWDITITLTIDITISKNYFHIFPITHSLTIDCALTLIKELFKWGLFKFIAMIVCLFKQINIKVMYWKSFWHKTYLLFCGLLFDKNNVILSQVFGLLTSSFLLLPHSVH